MQCIDFEKLLGVNISNITSILGNDFENKLFESNFYYIKNENICKTLNGMSFKTFSIFSNEMGIIESISIHFFKIMNKKFFDELISLYGLPNEIKVIDKKNELNNTFFVDENFSQVVKKSIVELREGSFEENPIFINWEKTNFRILVNIRHKQGTSELSFKKK